MGTSNKGEIKMIVGARFRDNQRNDYYNDWQVTAIKGNRVYCQLISNDMHRTIENGETGNFTKSTISEWEKV